MNIPMPKPNDDPMHRNQGRVTDQEVDDQLQTLASRDISEHAQIYETLLTELQQDLNQTGRGAQ
ncbi:hypothetical protein [Glutamicibacter uratoxydans]|uniref:hypothetical protein n=1 Tax=Glutamicibacter uratoxydans TaxID=43667 RepID=UPI003D6FB472